MKNIHLTRRRRLFTGVALLLLSVYAYGRQSGDVPVAVAAQASASCSGNITPAVTEGPYYKAGSPERTSLVTQSTGGTKVVLTGYVFDKNCQPISHAWLDFWQADAVGAYDNSGYNLRGHQYTDQAGRYTLETVVPGEYPGRTVHIHVKVQAPNGPVLTTQLFFPGVARNANDSIFNQALLVSVQDTATSKTAGYNFVLNVTTTPAAAVTPTPSAASSYTFKETGFTVSGDFWTAWQSGRSFVDSLFINGLPLTEARDEVSPTDGKRYKTQWFERARIEYHPENQAPYNVLLGLLGSAAVQSRQSEAPFKAVANPGSSLRWFSQTGHTVGDASAGGQVIAAFWNSSGCRSRSRSWRSAKTTARPTLCNTSSGSV